MPRITPISTIASSAANGVNQVFDIANAELPNPTVPIEFCDQALGNFMRAWNQVEHAIASAVEVLLGTDQRRARIMLEDVQQAALRDLLQHVGSFYLTTDQQKELNEILGEIKTLTGIRNKLVHGQWGIYIKKNNETGDIISAEWSRNSFVNDANTLREMFNPRSQRAKHLKSKFHFSPEQIIEEAEKVRPLAAKLTDLVKRLQVAPDHPKESRPQGRQASQPRRSKAVR